MPFRKHDDNTTSAGAGAFGRAVRKLTPRKASLINLMKGKGWNKSDEARSSDPTERNQETSSDGPMMKYAEDGGPCHDLDENTEAEDEATII
ncbi:hypothetical protein J4E91_007896 [Alternaria rosae]|nr:hypothetical protein J4E91_007896 [Alternaria rosae]